MEGNAFPTQHNNYISQGNRSVGADQRGNALEPASRSPPPQLATTPVLDPDTRSVVQRTLEPQSTQQVIRTCVMSCTKTNQHARDLYIYNISLGIGKGALLADSGRESEEIGFLLGMHAFIRLERLLSRR